MKTLQKKSLFWDVEKVNPRKNERFVLERILAYGDVDDVRWAFGFYGAEKIEKQLLNIKTLDRKSLSFWCQYFNINQKQCAQKQLMQKRSASWKQ